MPGRFERDLAEGQALLESDPYEAVARLDAAFGEWRGAAFAEFADEEWAARPRRSGSRSCGSSRPKPTSRRALRVGRHQEVVGVLEALRRRASAARAPSRAS